MHHQTKKSLKHYSGLVAEIVEELIVFRGFQAPSIRNH